MIFTGRLLWAEAPDADSSWVEGAWRIDEGIIRRANGNETADMSGYAIPGLADSHAHIAIGADGPVDRAQQERHLLAQRRTGVLALRDCGSPLDTSWADQRDDLPRVVRSGAHIARPMRYLRGLPVEVEDPRDLPDEVARQAEDSNGWVKLVGDWIDRSKGADSDLDPLWPGEALTDAVAAAHEAGARVAVHAFGHGVIDSLLEAGVDDIEHGTGMDEDQALEAARRGIIVTPTALQAELFSGFAAQAGRKYPAYASTMMRMYEGRREHFAMLRDAGVTLVMGTDSGGYQAHGTMGSELALWSQLGVPASEIIDIATWRTRRALDLPSLFEGAPADLLIYWEDPRGDASLIASPSRIILAGRETGSVDVS
ncbi:amidohydrolase family protein [Actinomyces mediterranea]|uniref:amidohydrolase family protein n=1 Tax=Actinomyces mediterranea TaxID=1871028 RepID=UPI0009711362|nr:amidohydrolase family protein [Actinomyces mediterranea]